MCNNMLGKLPLSDVQGPVGDLMEKLASTEGSRWLERFNLFLRGELLCEKCQAPGVPVAKPTKCKLLLETVGTVIIPATTSQFVAKEKFVRGTGRNAKVKISDIGSNFDAWFLNGTGKIEDPQSEQTLAYDRLRKASLDGPIIEELGGEAKAETTLTDMFSLMEGQGSGGERVLLNNGNANIFYIRDQNGVLRTVRVRWYDDGWFVFASSLELPLRWLDGFQVFSRNSVLAPSATVSA